MSVSSTAGKTPPRLDLAHVEERLAAYTHRPVPDVVARKRAAVSVLLRYVSGGPEVLLMKRAEREGDRWSGHVSFPGGRREEGDADLRETALRETREEVGLDLGAVARPLGRLDDIVAIAKGKVLPMAVSPFVFLQTGAALPVLNHEAESAFWFPLARASELRGTLDYTLGPVPLKLSCWRYEGYVIWGLTHKMISRFLAICR